MLFVGEQSSGLLIFANSINEKVEDGLPKHDILIGLQSLRQKPCEEGTKPAIYSSIGYSRSWMESVFDRGETGLGVSPLQHSSTTSPVVDTQPTLVVSFEWGTPHQGDHNSVAQEPDVEGDPYSLDELNSL